MLGLKLYLQLCNWDWGVRLLFSSERFVKYLTEREAVLENEVLVAKYEIVTKAI